MKYQSHAITLFTTDISLVPRNMYAELHLNYVNALDKVHEPSDMNAKVIQSIARTVVFLNQIKILALCFYLNKERTISHYLKFVFLYFLLLWKGITMLCKRYCNAVSKLDSPFPLLIDCRWLSNIHVIRNGIVDTSGNLIYL